MSTTSWAITNTKRKSKMAMPPPRKRQRVSEMKDNTRPSKSQKTLTQAQWMTPPSNQLANDELLLEENSRPRTLPRTHPRRRLKKRNSTLTQMDFFDSLPLDQEDIDDQLLPQVNTPGDIHVPIPQFDGAYNSPRKPRPQKAPVDLKQLREVKENLESQEYRPSTRKRTIQHMETEALSSGRRTSRRLASKQLIFSDPAQSFEYFNEALATPSRRVTPEREVETFVPQLEMKDSLQEKEEAVQTDMLFSTGSLVHLHTPPKNCTIILSSQSPESLPPSTRKRVRAESPTFESQGRIPLAECSINSWQVSPTKSSSKNRKLQSSQSTSPAKKLISLKLAKRLQSRQVPQIEDSQKNIWSIPSSSPLQQKDESIFSVRQAAPTTGDEIDEAEIPATSQAHDVISSPPAKFTQDSLPSVVDLVERRPLLNQDDSNDRDKAIRPQYTVHTGAIVRGLEPAPMAIVTSKMTELEERHSEAVLFHSETLLDEPKDLEPMLVEDSEEESIVSPAKLLSNKLSHDGSSTPIPKRWEGPGGQRRMVSISPFMCPVNDSSSPHPEQPMNEPQTPLPPPQLISQSATPRQLTKPGLPKDTNEVQLPRPPFLHRSDTHVSTTLIPLNDIEYAPSSSSLASTKATTQKSVNPASMPHPSQISTQDATQGFLNMSSFPRPFHDSYGEENNDKITIKDSSSCQVSMSQLPQHMSTTQSQPNIDLGLDEVFNSDEDGDLDLDPPSTASHHDHHPMSDIQIERTPPAKRTVDALRQESIGESDVMHADLNEEGPQVMGQAPDQTRSDSPIPSSQQSISIPSSPNPPPLQRKYDPIPGFDNDTQSNFTQNGHVTAAYIHRQREAGVLPEWYTPEPFQVPGYTRRK